MSDAKAKEIGEISETSFWFDDFAMAVQEIMSTLRVIGMSTNNPVKIYEIQGQYKLAKFGASSLHEVLLCLPQKGTIRV